ncbi:MAG: hypothetical protein EHM70_17875, partial [Chloroflexota bacterium]
MASSKDKFPSYKEIITSILASAQGPLPVKEIVERMLALHPSQAKNPQRAMHQHIREANGLLLVYLDPNTVLPLRLAYNGARFRLPLDRETVNKGLVNIRESLHSYLPLVFPLEEIRFVDQTGSPIPFQIKPVSQKVTTIFGENTITSEHADLGAWFRSQKMYHNDHLLFTIVDWEKGVFQLEREPARQRDEKLLEQRNQLLVDMFFALLEHDVSEAIYSHQAVPTIYAHLPDKSGYPPYHWLIAILQDGRMTTDGWRIHYSDSGFSMFERLIQQEAGERAVAQTQPITSEQRKQVYRFKAELAYRPNIWRVVEIQGKHTLADLDLELRVAFDHDTFDHMGGFWKLVPRGGKEDPIPLKRRARKQAKYREIELGDVDPLGGGDGAGSKIAGLGLSVGDKLKYVYDFGDWIEHSLTLEAIEEPEPRGKYPREAGHNEPEYVDCVECR